MKSLASILKENMETPVEEGSKFAERRKKIASAIASRAKKTGKSLSDFAKDVVFEPHV